MAEAVLEAKALTKRFGEALALNELDLAVWPGEVVCLAGANGAGKTTTLNLFLGFLEPTSGEARVCGRSAAADPAAARSAFGYVAEVVSLYPTQQPAGGSKRQFYHRELRQAASRCERRGSKAEPHRSPRLNGERLTYCGGGDARSGR